MVIKSSIKKFLHLRQFILMCLVGSIGMMVQLSFFNLFRFFYSPFLSLQLAIMLAILANFYAHSIFTFKDENFQLLNIMTRKGLLFIGFSLFNMFLQGHWMNLGVWYFGSSPWVENAIMLVGMGWGSLLSYLFYKRFIWK
jgi:dolichol-phosphate mannosyltransferase